MDERFVKEFVPGVGIGPEGGTFLCPGCWAEGVGVPVPEGNKLIWWFQMAVWILMILDYDVECMDPAKLAADYTEEPWHDA